jgi:IS5 family transposase
MHPGKRRAQTNGNEADTVLDKAEKLRTSTRAKLEHPFRLIKRQFGFMKVCDRELAKNTAQLKIPFAMSNLWMVRHKLMGAGE